MKRVKYFAAIALLGTIGGVAARPPGSACDGWLCGTNGSEADGLRAELDVHTSAVKKGAVQVVCSPIYCADNGPDTDELRVDSGVIEIERIPTLRSSQL